MKQWLDKIGSYDVLRIPMPHFSETVEPKSKSGVLHTTEGSWDASLSVFHVHFAPQFIVGVNAHHVAHTRVLMGQGVRRTVPPPPPEPSGAAQIAQMVPVGTIGAALRTHNNRAIVQVEVVGFAREQSWCFEAGTLDAVASLMAACHTEYGIPLSRPWPDGVYGRAGATEHRNEADKFGVTDGWYGHGDCPSPDTHWDPGNLQWSRVFNLAKQKLGAAPEPEA